MLTQEREERGAGGSLRVGGRSSDPEPRGQTWHLTHLVSDGAWTSKRSQSAGRTDLTNTTLRCLDLWL